MKKLLSILVILGCSTSMFAQNDVLCGIDGIHKKLMKIDASYKARFEDNEKKVRNKILTNKANKKLSTTQYTIPVVVHVIHLGESVGTGTNISDAQIQSAIDNLNTAYSGSGSYITDMNIDFVLAKRDGDCNPSTGIIRVDGSGTSDYATQGLTYNGVGSDNELLIKDLSRYPRDEFYNIWIVSEINNNGAGSGLQGFAYFPGSSYNLDGAVILYNAFGYDPSGVLGYELKSYTDSNAIAIHEMGHAFRLYHTFKGDDSNNDDTADQCPVNTDPSSDGDACADTDPHRRNDGNCGSSGETCAGAGTDLGDVVTNFMAYSNESCQVKFSNDQRERARTALETTRWSLINSSGGETPTTSIPTTTLSSTPVTQNLAFGSGVGIHGLTLDTTTYSSGSAAYDGGYHENACSHFDISSSNTYDITVRTGGVNVENVKVYIDYNNDGDFVDAEEEIFSSVSIDETHTGTFTVPAISSNVIANTPLWVRVISDYAPLSTNVITGPDYSPNLGQVEDFPVVISSSLSVNENELFNDLLKIFPNPTYGEFILNYNGGLNLEQLSVYNIIGKEVTSVSLKGFAKSKKIDLSNIEAGVYFVTIKSRELKVTKKIIIK
ncbi:zinc-dependent metalloprotease [Flavivirga spongiicola]|uniref:Zinc-dependent metalloprotease n=1 Tax=Flavivirga spongiicola TaxID=421621 RepID=A0ABU7XYK3_9FLAO|nr:zinc-dependent metalloprotease [Flavivirga sp. MEBiC05379]MDO5979939.1 zinc-dependent metalloprotease [Flavivirga sp. MEBiC05379]